MNLRAATLICTLLLSALAQAQYTTREVRLPEEYFGPDYAHAAPAAALAKTSAPLAGFRAEHSDWTFRVNPITGGIRHAWGKGIAIDGITAVHMLNVEPAANVFLRSHGEAFNANPENARLLYAQAVEGKGYVKYIQRYKNLDVINTYFDIRMSRGGRVSLLRSDFYKNIELNVNPALSVEQAKEAAKFGIDDAIDVFIEGGSLAVLPVVRRSGVDFRLVYNVVVPTVSEERWNTLVDAHSGEILWRKNLVQHSHEGDSQGIKGTTSVVNGRVMIKIYPVSPTMGSEERPCPHMAISYNGKKYYTDENGRFSVDLGAQTSGTATMRFSGRYADVQRDDVVQSDPNTHNSQQVVPLVANQETNILWDETNSLAAERNGYYHTTVVSRWIRALDTTANLSDVNKAMRVNINVDDYCNAFWNGHSINFFVEGGGCRNSGEIASVIYHEYGHGLDQFLFEDLGTSGWWNGALSEASADITANLLMDDSRVGVGMRKNGSSQGILRNSDNTSRYPEDSTGEIHEDGKILTGAMWDVRKGLGIDRTKYLAHYVKYGSPNSPNLGEGFISYFIELLFIDDDDDNLSNGTPNAGVIVPAFRKHGIYVSTMKLEHDRLADQAVNEQPIPVAASLSFTSTHNLGPLGVSTAQMVVTTDNWQTSVAHDLTYFPQTKLLTGTIPSFPAGASAFYYIKANDSYGDAACSPAQAPKAYHSVMTGFTRIFLDNAESDEGWTVTGDATSGHWVRDIPQVPPAELATGMSYLKQFIQDDNTVGSGNDRCWITGNYSGQSASDNEISEGKTVLTSRVLDLSALKNPHLRFYKWFFNSGASIINPDYFIVEISSNGGGSWKTLKSYKDQQAYWQPEVIRLKDVIDVTGQVAVRFSAQDMSPESYVRAGIDDVEILDIDLPVSAEDQPLAAGFSLAPNYPNPFSTYTDLAFSLPFSSPVDLIVFDVQGREVSRHSYEALSAGRHEVHFDGSGLRPGVYMVRLITSAGALSRGIMLAR